MKKGSWIRWIGVAIAMMAVLGSIIDREIKRRTVRSLPEHMTGHRVLFRENFLSPETAERLRALTKEMKTFPTNVNDLKFYSTFSLVCCHRSEPHITVRTVTPTQRRRMNTLARRLLRTTTESARTLFSFPPRTARRVFFPDGSTSASTGSSAEESTRSKSRTRR